VKTCKNCKTRYTNKFNYCPNCGAKWIDYRLTPRKITAEFTERYLGTENVFLRTCITLFRYPEDVINGYITGQRKKYVNVINFFFISLTLFGIYIFILKNFYPELLGLDKIKINDKDLFKYISWLYDYMGLFTTLFLPVYALSGRIVFYKKQYNFVEHLVLYTYVFSISNIFVFLLTPICILASVDYNIISAISTLLVLALTFWYYKRIFKISFWSLLGKTVLGAIIYSIFQIVIVVILIIIIIILINWFHPEILKEFNNINLNGTLL